ncbi:PQQ-dependent sugar dehydrogenase [Sphingomonas qomolangmaensis]|uniref:PQQ-dependent sugar dehydrogenase n=1 Tax=Sphingomonas qomolangmaensis TaxID=2918765 RepID=A0ABY5L914_9SPHN|nr:PQQ-dependent sugar dehydrogenase [Sphingomonas qomolangmaensis]UUL82068.1 PQQ-dependent sugar dehydrogenase [Sphingomonas qomolangmaensis]
MTPRARLAALCAPLALLAGCDGGGTGAVTPTPTPTPAPTPAPTPTPTPTPAPPTTTVCSAPVASFDSPWAMTFLPDGRLLVTERGGTLRIVTQAGEKSQPIAGVPVAAAAGQGGLLDVVLHPQFASNRLVYLSFAEAGSGGKGLAVARGTLSADALRIDDLAILWRQAPKVAGDGHFGGRIAFAADGRMFVTAGERQQGTPAQDRSQTLGVVVRLTDTGGVPTDNPFVGQAGFRPEIWSFGHRNPYGLVFDASGRLLEHEHGPEGGDELNVIERGGNYGWPRASNGSDYGGGDIPDHRPGDGYVGPAAFWTPVIAPAGMIIYSGTLFSGWQGQALIGGLVQQGLVRVALTGATASEVQRIPLGRRIREVEQGPDGAIWVLEDGAGGRLLKLTPG